LTVMHELVASLVGERGLLPHRISPSLRFWRQALSQRGKHASIDGVGLGQKACRTREVAGAARINPRMADVAGRQRLPQQPIIVSGGLKHDEHVAAMPAIKQADNGFSPIGDAGCPLVAALKDVEMMLGNIDSDKARVYDHRAYPCAARSVCPASINCSGLGVLCGRGSCRLTVFGPGTVRSPARSHP